jgi:hypothetical protein
MGWAATGHELCAQRDQTVIRFTILEEPARSLDNTLFPQKLKTHYILMIPQISARARGPLAAATHKAGCGPSKSPDRMRVCMSCIRVANLSCL